MPLLLAIRRSRLQRGDSTDFGELSRAELAEAKFAAKLSGRDYFSTSNRLLRVSVQRTGGLELFSAVPNGAS
jgi:hypothetical protein